LWRKSYDDGSRDRHGSKNSASYDDPAGTKSTVELVNTASRNPWEAILALVRGQMDEEDFRRWFGVTAYASDSGDQISVWVPTEAIRRHLMSHFQQHIDQALEALDRAGTNVRFIVTGISDDEDEKENI
jgi:hypothetical protein